MLLTALKLFMTLSLLTGVIYPYTITLIAQGFFQTAAEGSLLYKDNQKRGSRWVAQPFTQPQYFWPRPSAGDYNSLPSSASQAGPTSASLKQTILQRREMLAQAHNNPKVPDELLLASGSGLDPHLSPQAVAYQVARVARARGLQPTQLAPLIAHYTEAPQAGFLGQARINVLELNLALDRHFQRSQP